MEKASKRVNAVQEVKESVSLLSQLLGGYSKESCSQSSQELIKVSANQHLSASCSYSLITWLATFTGFQLVFVSRIFTSVVKK